MKDVLTLNLSYLWHFRHVLYYLLLGNSICCEVIVYIHKCHIKLHAQAYLKNHSPFLFYRCTRVYWSTTDARRRTVYTCRVIEVHPSENNETTITMKVSKITRAKRAWTVFEIRFECLIGFEVSQTKP